MPSKRDTFLLSLGETVGDEQEGWRARCPLHPHDGLQLLVVPLPNDRWRAACLKCCPPGKIREALRERRLQSIRLSDVQPKPVEWLWTNRIAFGKLCLIEGDPGRGKSSFTLDFAARLSTGRPMPGDERAFPPSNVVFLASEDGLSDTMRPRLDAAEADAHKIHALGDVLGPHGAEGLSLPKDIPQLEKHLRLLGARLVVIDPLMGTLDGDAFKEQEVRKALLPLARMAERLNVAVLLVRHLRKGEGPAIYRGGGSIGIMAVARTALLVGDAPDNPDERIIVPVKSNLGPPARAWRFGFVQQANKTARLEWLGECDIRPDELANGHSDSEGATALQNATEFVKEALADGPLPTTELESRGREAGYSQATLQRATRVLGLEKTKKGFRGPWFSSLPAPRSKTLIPEQ